jgi:predicted RNase H-like HicB family nuclease
VIKTFKALPVVIEWLDGGFGAYVNAPGFLFTTQGDSVRQVTANLRELIADYLNHEGSEMPEWQGLEIADVHFNCIYDLKAFFGHFNELKISAIAARAGLNPNLVQQYVSGNKKASEGQAKKLEKAVHELASELKQIALM